MTGRPHHLDFTSHEEDEVTNDQAIDMLTIAARAALEATSPRDARDWSSVRRVTLELEIGKRGVAKEICWLERHVS